MEDKLLLNNLLSNFDTWSIEILSFVYSVPPILLSSKSDTLPGSEMKQILSCGRELIDAKKLPSNHKFCELHIAVSDKLRYFVFTTFS